MIVTIIRYLQYAMIRQLAVSQFGLLHDVEFAIMKKWN